MRIQAACVIYGNNLSLLVRSNMKIQGVTESVLSHLRQKIITAELPPDSKLNEIELADLFGVSRPPLREAFRKLENENLILSVPRKGSYVSGVSQEDCMQIYRARVMLECGAIDIIGEQGLDVIEKLEKTLAKEKEFVPPAHPSLEDMPTFFKVMSRFHNTLMECCGNRWIVHFYKQQQSSMARYQIMYLRLPGSRNASQEEHEKVFKLIKANALEEAKKEISQHILKTRDALIDRIGK